MAFFRGTIYSEKLKMDTGLSVILPNDHVSRGSCAPRKALYLLHGLSDACDAWVRYTGIERYVKNENIAVIMPEVQRSFYMDMTHGLKYFSYVADELPKLCRKMFGLSEAREDTFVAGLSMGGFGALKCGFLRPNVFSACASFSGAVDIRKIVAENGESELAEELKAAFGTELIINEQDELHFMAEKLIALPESDRPRIFITCGLQDFLYEDNIRFKKRLESAGVEFSYAEWPGKHEWGFWDESIKLALNFFLQ